MTRYIFLFYLLFAISSCSSTSNEEAVGVSYDVIIDTDLGGDPDDIQSLFRALHYSDVLNIEAIVSTPCNDQEGHPWDTVSHTGLIKEWIRRVDLDHLREMGYKELMKEEQLLNAVYAGSREPGLPSEMKGSEGSRKIIEIARDHNPENQVWILVWGSMTTLAQALYEEPAIAPNIRIYSIGSTNTQHDSLSRNYIYNFMEKSYPGIWWIENGVLPKGSHETFRGVYQGGNQEGEWNNMNFAAENIRGHGSDHDGMFREKCGDVFPVATWPGGSLKEGDSPSILYLLSPVIADTGNVDDPTRESWGGKFRPANRELFPNYYIDLDRSPEECQKTINKWRLQYLSDWKYRWDRYDIPKEQ